MTRPLLVAGAGLAAAVAAACGGSENPGPPIGNPGRTICDAGTCPPDGGLPDAGNDCFCPASAD